MVQVTELVAPVRMRYLVSTCQNHAYEVCWAGMDMGWVNPWIGLDWLDVGLGLFWNISWVGWVVQGICDE